MKIGFVGCGAIGSCYASYLVKNHEVCVLDTSVPVIEAVRKDGILRVHTLRKLGVAERSVPFRKYALRRGERFLRDIDRVVVRSLGPFHGNAQHAFRARRYAANARKVRALRLTAKLRHRARLGFV